MRLQFLCLSVWIHLSCRWPSDSSTDRLVPVEEECLLGSLPLCVTLPWISCIVSKFSGHILRAVSYQVNHLFSCDSNLTGAYEFFLFFCMSSSNIHFCIKESDMSLNWQSVNTWRHKEMDFCSLSMNGFSVINNMSLQRKIHLWCKNND